MNKKKCEYKEKFIYGQKTKTRSSAAAKLSKTGQYMARALSGVRNKLFVAETESEAKIVIKAWMIDLKKNPNSLEDGQGFYNELAAVNTAAAPPSPPAATKKGSGRRGTSPASPPAAAKKATPEAGAGG